MQLLSISSETVVFKTAAEMVCPRCRESFLNILDTFAMECGQWLYFIDMIGIKKCCF